MNVLRVPGENEQSVTAARTFEAFREVAAMCPNPPQKHMLTLFAKFHFPQLHSDTSEVRCANMSREVLHVQLFCLILSLRPVANGYTLRAAHKGSIDGTYL